MIPIKLPITNKKSVMENTKRVYDFDSNTGKFLGSNLRPASYKLNPNCQTLIKPIETQPPEISIFKNGKWEKIEDHIDKIVYSKTDKSQFKIIDLGPIYETYTEKKPGLYDKWNGSDWVEDKQLKKDAELLAKREEKKAKILNIIMDCIEEDDPNIYDRLKEELGEET